MPYGFGYTHGGYTAAQYGPVVLSSGRRKHLNLLIDDRCVENSKTYGWENPTTGFSMGSSKQRAHTAPATAGQEEAGPRVTWNREAGTPPVNEALAVKVGNKRTPSGNFFGTINSALVEKQPPPNFYAAEDMTLTAAAAMKAQARARQQTRQEDMLPSPQSHFPSHHSSVDFGDQRPSPSTGNATVYQFSSSAQDGTAVHQAAMNGSSSQRSAAWLMPWQTGDTLTG